MENEEIALKLEGHEHEIKSAKHRLDDLEEQNKSIQELVLSVRELAINMRNMMDEQKEQGERLKILEKVPASRWNDLVKIVMTAIVSGVAGALLSNLF